MLLLALVTQLASMHPGWVATECPAGGDTVRTRCGWVEVVEDRSRPGGRTIRLFVMRKDPPDSARRPGSDPIVFLDGGPGRSAHADAWWAELVLGALPATHALVFADQRGTGKSAPLDCDLWPERRTSDRRFPVAGVRRCREELAPNVALERYATRDAVMDLESVRRALGVERLNLFGVSYGARVALGYAVLFPGRVRTLALLSPGTFVRWPEVTRDASRWVFALATRGQGLDAPDAMLRGLQDAALTVPFTRGSRTDSVRVGPRVGAWLIRDLLYDPFSWQRIGPLLRAFQERRADSVIAASLEDFARGDSDRSLGSFLGITCTEDVGAGAGSFTGDWAAAPQDEFAEICRDWPHAPLPRWWGRTPPSTIPALLLSGRWDPVTPADSAAAFAGRLGGAHSLVVERGGHAGTWPCAIRAVERFVLRGATAGLPATCR